MVRRRRGPGAGACSTSAATSVRNSIACSTRSPIVSGTDAEPPPGAGEPGSLRSDDAAPPGAGAPLPWMTQTDPESLRAEVERLRAENERLERRVQWRDRLRRASVVL